VVLDLFSFLMGQCLWLVLTFFLLPDWFYVDADVIVVADV
jgi:hypothetical protein